MRICPHCFARSAAEHADGCPDKGREPPPSIMAMLTLIETRLTRIEIALARLEGARPA